MRGFDETLRGLYGEFCPVRIRGEASGVGTEIQPCSRAPHRVSRPLVVRRCAGLGSGVKSDGPTALRALEVDASGKNDITSGKAQSDTPGCGGAVVSRGVLQLRMPPVDSGMIRDGRFMRVSAWTGAGVYVRSCIDPLHAIERACQGGLRKASREILSLDGEHPHHGMRCTFHVEESFAP